MFLVCPRWLGAGELAAAAEALAPGAVESVRAELVPEKGMSYVTFRAPADARRALQALRAQGSELAGCKVKAMLAEPPRAPRRGRSGGSRASSRGSGGRLGGFESGSRGAVSGGAVGATSSGGEVGGVATPSGGLAGEPPASPRLFVVLPKVVSQDALRQLFSKFPGMERCDLKLDRASGRSKGFAYVTFTS